MVSMASPKKRRNNGARSLKKIILICCAIGFGILTIFILSNDNDASTSTLLTTSTGYFSKANRNVEYGVDETCTNLPTIRPGGSYFLDGKIGAGKSPDSVSPAFHVGSRYPDKVVYHMNADVANFHLIKEIIHEHGDSGGLVFDIGANQGFYTYYLAALGMQVHSFEINEENFRSLQHGAEFNPKSISDHVNVYPVGLGKKNGRFGMKGNNYGGFLKEGGDAPIMGVTFDCFAHHMKGKLDISNVAFVKLDVEGFEIAVLQGFANSLYKYSKIGGMLMEVGPERWGRASIDFSTGVAEMKTLATHFKSSFVILRTASHSKSCPTSLADGVLVDKNPRKIETVEIYTVAPNEWGSLLEKMNTNKFDCNFFYKN